MQAQSRTDFDLVEYVPLIEEVIASGGEFRLFPRGTSMLPLIRQGKDSVILVLPKDLSEGDIVFYRRPDGQFVLHRIIKKSKDGSFVLCGDNQTVLEKGIISNMIIAVVSAVFRDEKRIEKTAFGRIVYEFFWCIMPLRKLIFFSRRVLSRLKRIFSKK